MTIQPAIYVAMCNDKVIASFPTPADAREGLKRWEKDYHLMHYYADDKPKPRFQIVRYEMSGYEAVS
jgi:hypothetical protein